MGFREFDFEGSKEWQQYRANLEIPANRDVNEALLRLKAKWYKREVDPDFDVSSVRDAPESNMTSNPESSTSSTSRPVPAKNAANTSSSTSGSTQQPSSFLQRMKKLLSIDDETRLFLLHVSVIFFALQYFQPFISAPKAYSRFLQTAAITHGFKVTKRYGVPKVWPFKLDNITTWLKSASSSTDFQYVMLALVFIPSRPLLLVMVPFTTLAVYHVAAYACQHYSETAIWQRFCIKPYRWLAARQQQAVVCNAAAEIGTGFLVILSLLTPPRNIFLVFIHWQWLRMRFWSPDSANNHRLVWSQLDNKVGKYTASVPFLNVLIGYIQKWFQSAQTMQRR